MSWLNIRLDRKMSLKHLLSIRSFLMITFIVFTLSMICIQFVNNSFIESDSLVQEVIENVGRDLRYADIYRRADKLSKNLKYMLIWSGAEDAPLSYFGGGQRKFLEKNCTNINCYVTTDRNFFNGDTTKFHAIAFNGRTITTMGKSQLPKRRSHHQKFIYFNMESADNYPLCSAYFDDFFNWTATYRLDSDIPLTYIQIRDNNGTVVGPKKDMKWVDMGFLEDEELELRMQNKTKAVAWFVSHCKTRSKRKDYAIQLKKALYSFGFSVDIYGKCGPFKCPRHKEETCFSLLERDYAFYLSFENSFAEDYVTEKILTALQHTTVPIVRGGADYSRFLPPGSYVDATKVTPNVLASEIVHIMMNTKYYSQFFRWWSHYSYRDPSQSDHICALCDALNDESKRAKTSTYKNFRKWWNTNNRCK
nr:alpha-(1,3)-fucosyltransferase C-like [Danaus plexippus plexippus]XP_032522972.1 alpha-(1,3)-fucosyltransferase C-like [Danaus plexippus plexippus]